MLIKIADCFCCDPLKNYRRSVYMYLRVVSPTVVVEHPSLSLRSREMDKYSKLSYEYSKLFRKLEKAIGISVQDSLQYSYFVF